MSGQQGVWLVGLLPTQQLPELRSRLLPKPLTWVEAGLVLPPGILHRPPGIPRGA